jgi:hypothetical protein
MAVWVLDRFVDAAARTLDLYEKEYAWFKWPDRKTSVQHAWKLYRAAATNQLGMILLGDAKIRTNAALLMNFGLTSGSGVAAGDELKQIERLMAGRQQLVGRHSGAAVQVLGPGSILNDQNWSPLMNDALILGGVHTAQDFHWAEEGFDRFAMVGAQEFIQRREVFNQGTAAPVALRRDQKYYQDKWKHYLLGQSNFWSGGFARIFARELIGLKTFGYRAVCTEQEVLFTPGGAAAATFDTYLHGLRAVNFGNNDRVSINRAIGEFLFGDPAALTNLGDGTAQQQVAGPHLLKKSAKPSL